MHDRIAVEELSVTLDADERFRAKLARHALPPDDADLLMELALRSVFGVAPRSEIIAESADDGCLHVLLSGWACKYRLLPDGRRQVGPILLSGDICDLDAIGGGGPALGVLALSECRVAALRREVIAPAMKERPAVAGYLMALLVAENTAMVRQIVNLGRRSARERTADLLCDLLGRLQENGEALDNRIRCALTQTDMADHLGLSAVHTNRALKELKSSGLLAGRGSLYVVRDLDGLRTVAGL